GALKRLDGGLEHPWEIDGWRRSQFVGNGGSVPIGIEDSECLLRAKVAACTRSGSAVKRPVRPIQIVLAKIAQQGFEPEAVRARRRTFQARRLRMASSKLSHPDRSGIRLIGSEDIAPGLIQLLVELRFAGELTVVEGIVVRFVSEMTRKIQDHREIPNAGQVGCIVDPFYENDQVGIGVEYGVAAAFGSGMPVGCGGTAPCGVRARFVTEVGGNHL